MTAQPDAPVRHPNDGRPADTTHAGDDVAALLLDYFGAKSAHDIDATHSFFHPHKVEYFDATLGWGYRTNAELRGVWDRYIPAWPPTAKSYATKILGDSSGAIVFMTDTPELFGGEIRALGVVDFEDGKIVRWVDYWDARNFGAAAAAQLRVPAGEYPTDLGVGSVDSAGTARLRDTVDLLTKAFAAGDAATAAALFDDDAVFEDLTLRTTIRGRAAITRYLGRALTLLPYAAATVTHVVGGDLGGGYEWRSDDAAVPRGVVGLELRQGRVHQLTAVWDGALLDGARLRSLVLAAVEEAAGR